MIARKNADLNIVHMNVFLFMCKAILMKILWFTWKDLKNPLAGGAEVVNEELCKRLANDGHEVIIVVAGFKDAKKEEIINGYKVIRVGNRWNVYWCAYQYYKQYLRGWADLVIDEMNTMPFFCKYYVKEKNIMFVHQLCRIIWFYQLPWIIAWIGYLAEIIYLRLLNDRKVITVSESTKKDLMRFGFKAENINIISEGIILEPVKDIESIVKYPKPTILAFGAIRPMKRTLHIIKAFELAKKELPKLELVVAGDANCAYGKKVLKYIHKSIYAESIKYFGKVDLLKKIELMQKAHLLCVTSVKEGWGLVVTEANSQGTPAVVYNVDGLRDSVAVSEVDLDCPDKNLKCLAKKIEWVLIAERKYRDIQKKSVQSSNSINFENCFEQFSNIIWKAL